MKKTLARLLLASVLISANAAALPTFYDNLTILRVETWPNATDQLYSVTVYLTAPLAGTGCSNANLLAIEPGDYHRAALSILLSAQASGRPIRVRVSRCTDRPVVDRVAIGG